MTAGINRNADSILDAAYHALDLVGGDLLSATSDPNAGADADPAVAANWIDKGEWLALAAKARAEKVFFVRDNPVLVFARSEDRSPELWQQYFQDTWCMARPQILFLETPGELVAYDLTKGPSRTATDDERSTRVIDVARSASEVQAQLQRFRRDRIESGRLFEEYRFGDNRADSALVRDIQTIRRRLVDAGVDPSHANSLIGRSLFIRYLEDRAALDAQYFQEVAKGTRAWVDCLKAVGAKDSVGKPLPIFPHVLSDKNFTYALFDRLAVDFNGDVFPVGPNERAKVSPDHLNLLKNLLLGQAEPSLFFFAYRFDIVPIELISNIYEEFLRSTDGGKPTEGSYYTRSSLVEFLLNQTLTEDVLDMRPRVMDPACGSGIFLVESFRRIVRHRVRELRRQLTTDELHSILREQIAGIDINPEAVRVAAFSLYLALLHYLDPPTIRNHKLPCLVYPNDCTRIPDREYFDVLVAANAFEIEKSVTDAYVQKRFGSACAHIVVGNPPWGTPKGNDFLARESREGTIRWCEARNRPLGDKELSQAFVYRTLDLLTEGGDAALLVSSGVFFKRHKKSQLFRQQWLEEATLQQVVNFAAVRHFFFQRPAKSKARNGGQSVDKEGAISPFASVRFRKQTPSPDHRFQYWSAKRTAVIEQAEAVLLSRTDVHWVGQDELLQDERLWKVFWWGGHRDAFLIRRLGGEASLRSVVKQHGGRVRRGYQPEPPKVAVDWLSKYAELPTRLLTRYERLPVKKFRKVPSRVFRRGQQESYSGRRILLKRGISERGDSRGIVVARIESARFCFRDSIYCIKIPKLDEDHTKVLLGMLWSSLSRYVFFMTSGRWGMWHNDLQKDTLGKLPVRMPSRKAQTTNVVRIVDQLRQLPSSRAANQQGSRRRDGASHSASGDQRNLFAQLDDSNQDPAEFVDLGQGDYIRKLEAELDDAIFDLYELSEDERDLVREMCNLGLDYMYRGRQSKAVEAFEVLATGRRSGRRSDLAEADGIVEELRDYIRIFLALWEPRLKRNSGWLRWRVVLGGSDASMLAIVFSTESADDRLPDPTDNDEAAWRWILSDLAASSTQQECARDIYIDGVLRLVTPNDIAIIKRNERRLWTRTAAREDAEATMADILIHSQKPERERGKKRGTP